MALLPYSLILLLLSIPLPSALAAGLGTVPVNGTCNLANNGLDPDTRRFVTDCDATGYCSSQGVCEPKGCRKDQYAFGYGSNPQPPLCPSGTFCPDEENICLPLIDVGSPCQLNRDDECAPPPNSDDLSSSMNSNGSVCLSFTCQWQNATIGSPCIVENVAYTGYGSHGSVFIQVVSRDNCKTPESYCDGSQRVCMRVKAVGDSCGGDKECGSYNCHNGACGQSPGAPRQLKTWEYVITGVGIVLLMVGIFVVLFVVHRRQRDSRRAEIAAYWQEQTSYRRSLFAMQSAYPSLSRPGSGTMYALAPSSPSMTTFAESDTMRGREGWTMHTEDSRTELVGGSSSSLDAGGGPEPSARDSGTEKKRTGPL
ncbi:hypothetical protein CALCODRAFT_453649 [Calocera cornea HHB12733]|uniref:Uncharacterized protein n=1 Tax=Calocera cornea HHB12733 TaxID=1353952 RepID=A0A165FLZ2_9BASI|nr:hypothetical protein CALCODRAFT_453649 [Calocera cornea HHB12733]